VCVCALRSSSLSCPATTTWMNTCLRGILCVCMSVCVCVCVWRLQQILVQSSEHVLINTNVWVLYWHIKMSGVRGKGNAHSSNLQLVVLLVIATPHSYPSLQHDREPCRELNI